ncbi:hypothetical protein PsorP6_007005 [Peronosclerospora sorghi]|uniref:Uncharacterized protein n=1 Tax=Peronosclerospora sorghi TaxID=230839 RepID=A0ACC0W8J1_9STRA|nr:hypothetical protein PsorP6_007005 [Peronosclerospora sorghi]
MTDLTELLAAFDLCELQAPNLIALRDRAFQREITSDIELLQIQILTRQLQELVTPDVVSTAVELDFQSFVTTSDVVHLALEFFALYTPLIMLHALL